MLRSVRVFTSNSLAGHFKYNKVSLRVEGNMFIKFRYGEVTAHIKYER